MQVHSIIHIQVAKADLEAIPRLSSHYILSLPASLTTLGLPHTLPESFHPTRTGATAISFYLPPPPLHLASASPT